MKTNLNRSSQLTQKTAHRPQPTPSPHLRPSASIRGSQCSLRNTDGFWQLTFRGRSAIVPQHPALFFVAWLLTHPSAQPTPAIDLVLQVHDAFSLHPDFRENLSLAAGLLDGSALARLLLKKEAALHAILDSDDEPQHLRNEADCELAFIHDLQRTLLGQKTCAADQIASQLATRLVDLHNRLAIATDVQGRPHPLLRAFSRHLLQHLLAPSIRFSCALTHFTYQPPSGTAWIS